MSLLFIDSFDHYDDNTEMGRKWDTIAGSLAWQSGRTGNCVRLFHQAYAIKQLDDYYSTIVVGFGFLASTNNQDTYFFTLNRDGTEQIQLKLVSSAINLYRGGSLLGSSSTFFSTSTWYFLELKVYSHDSSGIAQLKVNGDLEIDYSGDTLHTGYPNQFKIYVPYSTYNYFDDLYVLDDTGGTNDDFLGDIKVECLRPTGAGNSTDFTPSTGSNWQNVDDSTPDDDSTYNYHAPQGLPGTDLFTMGDLTTISGGIFGIQPVIYARKDDAGSATLAPVLRTNSTDYVYSGESLADSYEFHTSIMEENPNTATAWTVTDINNIEGGYRRTS